MLAEVENGVNRSWFIADEEGLKKIRKSRVKLKSLDTSERKCGHHIIAVASFTEVYHKINRLAIDLCRCVDCIMAIAFRQTEKHLKPKRIFCPKCKWPFAKRKIHLEHETTTWVEDPIDSWDIRTTYYYIVEQCRLCKYEDIRKWKKEIYELCDHKTYFWDAKKKDWVLDHYE